MLTGPNNTIVKLGDNVEFECSMPTSATTPQTIPLDWAFISATSSQNIQYLYTCGQITHNISSKYAIKNTARGGYNLIVNSVDHSFGGTYTCSELGDQGASASAELIVIGKVVIRFF